MFSSEQTLMECNIPEVPKLTLQPKWCQMSVFVEYDLSHQVYWNILGLQDPLEGSCGPKLALNIPVPKP
jgi:hypothetical protein